MAFKVKDLMIDVSSATGALQCQPTLICRFGCTYLAFSGCHLACTYLAFSGCHLGCSFYLPSLCAFGSVTQTITCPGSLVTDTGTILQTIPQLSGEALGNLKEQLKQALDLAEKQQAAEAEAQAPQTLADVEMLEKKLGEALDELRARKAELHKKK
jgi:hypothetical protein